MPAQHRSATDAVSRPCWWSCQGRRAWMDASSVASSRTRVKRSPCCAASLCRPVALSGLRHVAMTLRDDTRLVTLAGSARQAGGVSAPLCRVRLGLLPLCADSIGTRRGRDDEELQAHGKSPLIRALQELPGVFETQAPRRALNQRNPRLLAIRRCCSGGGERSRQLSCVCCCVARAQCSGLVAEHLRDSPQRTGKCHVWMPLQDVLRSY